MTGVWCRGRLQLLCCSGGWGRKESSQAGSLQAPGGAAALLKSTQAEALSTLADAGVLGMLADTRRAGTAWLGAV